MPDGPRLNPALGAFAPFEHVTRVQALRDFVDWLYDTGPDPNLVTRERLLQTYWDRVASEAIQSASPPERERDAATINGILTFPRTRPDVR